MKHNMLVLLMIIIGISMITVGIVTISYNSKETNKKNEQVTSDENKEEDSKSEYIEEEKIYEVHDIQKDNVKSITTLTFTYDGKTLTSPFTLKDMEDIGINIDEHYMEQLITSGTGLGNIDGFTRFTYDNNTLHISVINNTNDTLYSKDCVVDYISTSNTEVTINGITPGTTNYKDILEAFGRDSKDRMNLFVNENKRQIEMGSFSNTMSYSSQNENFEWVYLDISLEVDYDNNTLLDQVKTVTYKK